ncbi:response regulator transcription factor [Ammoniphilus sp. CFH 90114]|uniref:response regulator n=1 Tax=Ammoniphilus sp. CFH 90114 TaxID=2493665 RepID=UPI00100E0710|nr:response regulator transcription factor [Ammoniphilus sp. CFH 90114]RXT07071.1 response regulator transcription factor [Ammoniphilus sp. CFH 90114]
MIKLYIADDHNIVREGLHLLFNQPQFQVIGESGDGETACREIRELMPDVALLDVSMPKKDGIEAAREIKQQHPHMKVILLTIYTDEKFLVEAMRAGADGYVLKTIGRLELFEAIEKVLLGERFIDPSLTKQALLHVIHSTSPEANLLSKREKDVLQLMAKGKTNKEISSELFLGTDTVKEYVTNVIKKLSCKNRTEAVAKAIRNQWI